MSETNNDQPKPPADPAPLAELPVSCPKCGKPFNLTQRDMEGLLQMYAGNLFITELGGFCLQCKTRFYWNVRDKDIVEMLRMVKILMDGRVYQPE